MLLGRVSAILETTAICEYPTGFLVQCSFITSRRYSVKEAGFSMCDIVDQLVMGEANVSLGSINVKIIHEK